MIPRKMVYILLILKTIGCGFCKPETPLIQAHQVMEQIISGKAKTMRQWNTILLVPFFFPELLMKSPII